MDTRTAIAMILAACFGMLAYLLTVLLKRLLAKLPADSIILRFQDGRQVEVPITNNWDDVNKKVVDACNKENKRNEERRPSHSTEN